MNQREIKFRVWNKTTKNMLDVTLMKFSPSLVQIEVSDWSKTNTIADEYELMQFTGLLDKNGKEIYEFDQLKGDWDVVNDVYLGTVEFYGGAFRIKETGLPLAWADTDRNCEVVGNKFEGL